MTLWVLGTCLQPCSLAPVYHHLLRHALVRVASAAARAVRKLQAMMCQFTASACWQKGSWRGTSDTACLACQPVTAAASRLPRQPCCHHCAARASSAPAQRTLRGNGMEPVSRRARGTRRPHSRRRCAGRSALAPPPPTRTTPAGQQTKLGNSTCTQPARCERGKRRRVRPLPTPMQLLQAKRSASDARGLTDAQK